MTPHPSLMSAARRLPSQRRSLLSHAVTGALLFAPMVAAAQVAYVEPGKVGQVESWRTPEFQLDWGLAALGAEHAYARGLTGNGIAIGQYDDGVALQMPEFAGKGHVSLHLGEASCGAPNTLVFRSGTLCFASDGDSPGMTISVENAEDGGLVTTNAYDNHGTHVAGTMVASRNGEGMHGVAFGSQLVTARFYAHSIKYSKEGADGQLETVSEGAGPSGFDPRTIESMYAQMNDQHVQAVNVEIWNPIPASPPEANTAEGLAEVYQADQASYDAFADSAIKYGMVNVVANGNDEGRIANIYPSLPTFRPDAEAYWLSVANVGKDGVIDASSSICAQSKFWCVAAPGTDITSTVAANAPQATVAGLPAEGPIEATLGESHPIPGYADMTGTSMAAPHAIGALSLLLERYPYLTTPQVRDVLLTTAKDLGAAGVDEIYGWGLIDLKKAIDGPGMLRVDTNVDMNQLAGGAKVWEGAAWDDWRNDISGPGRLTKAGAGWLRLSGANSFGGLSVNEGVLELDGVNTLGGNALVQGGALLINGRLIDTDLDIREGVATVQGSVSGGTTRVGGNGLLRGTGTLGNTEVAGMIAPGIESIGTLRVEGNYSQAAGSVYEVDVQAPGQSDRIAVSGQADLRGGQVRVVSDQANLGDSYRILEAASVSGQFADVSGAVPSPFLAWKLTHSANAVDLSVGRGLALVTAADTLNQTSTALAADALADSNPLLQKLTRLDAAQAQAAFDRLNPEFYASQNAVLATQAQRINDLALLRSRTAQDAFARQAEEDKHNHLWVDAQSQGGHLDGMENAARTNYHNSGITLGYDYGFDNGWSIGAVGASMKGDAQARERAARSESQSRYAGLYGGKTWGGFGLRAGWLVSRHTIDTRRDAVFAGYQAQHAARYHADGQQGFVDAGYTFRIGPAFQLEPYVQWSRVDVKSDRFVESGSLTALSVDRGHQRVDFATGGARFGFDLGQGGGESWLRLGGALAYRVANKGEIPVIAGAWARGDAFGVAGAAMAHKATLANLNLAARLSENSLLELGYDGQFGKHATDHGVNARFSLAF